MRPRAADGLKDVDDFHLQGWRHLGRREGLRQDQGRRGVAGVACVTVPAGSQVVKGGPHPGGSGDWRRGCGSGAERIRLIGRGDVRPSVGSLEIEVHAVVAHHRRHLVVAVPVRAAENRDVEPPNRRLFGPVARGELDVLLRTYLRVTPVPTGAVADQELLLVVGLDGEGGTSVVRRL